MCIRDRGKVFKFTYRNNASTGPFGYGQGLTDAEKGDEWWHMEAAGGGAFLDYCCYGACMASWFLGQRPTAAYGLKANFASQYGDAEDYGAVMARYPEAVAILEEMCIRDRWCIKAEPRRWWPMKPIKTATMMPASRCGR